MKQLLKKILPKPVVMWVKVKRSLRGSGDPEVQLLPCLARSGAFLDIGANLGTWTGPAARAFRSVHAFEPDSEIAAALRSAVPPNVTVHELALSDREGTGRFAIPVFRGQLLKTRSSLEANANVGHDEVIREVRLTRLDSLSLNGVDVVKIDVEGHEEAVLDGASQTIARERPTLIVEIEERHHRGRSELIIERLVSQGYRCVYLSAGRLMPFQPGEIDVLQPESLVPVAGTRAAAYVNNFIFVPVERMSEITAIESALIAQGKPG